MVVQSNLYSITNSFMVFVTVFSAFDRWQATRDSLSSQVLFDRPEYDCPYQNGTLCMKCSALYDVYIEILGGLKAKAAPENRLDQMKMSSNDLKAGNKYRGMSPGGEFDYSILRSSEITNDVLTNLKNQNLSTNKMNL